MKNPKLAEPLNLRGLTLRNRLTLSPMCQYSAGNDGTAGDWHLVHYGSRAAFGVGLALLEATAVESRGRISPWDLGLWDDAQVPGLERIVGFVHAQGSAAGVQLAHAGRKGSTARPHEGGRVLGAGQGGWTCVGPSALAFREGDPAPEALDEDGIRGVIAAFADAARRADRAGFDVVELHGAHGYLLHQFLSPLANRRTDRWGGSFENRVRLLLETVRAVRAVWPDRKPLFVRLSATDWAAGGWTEAESVELAVLLKAAGVDLVDVSSGGMVPGPAVPVGPGYQVPFAASLRRTGIPTACVGLIDSAEQAEAILGAGSADLVMLGRELLRNPAFPWQALYDQEAGPPKVADGHGTVPGLSLPAQYLRGWPTRK